MLTFEVNGVHSEKYTPEVRDNTHCSVEGDIMRVTDENGKTVAKFHRVYVSHWWIWAEVTNTAA